MENTRWVFFIVVLLGTLHSLTATGTNDYDTSQLRGDIHDSPSQAVGATGLGFSGIEQRHDGYVKGEIPTIPKTSFTCSAQPFNPGLYADMETQCQVYHVCFGDRQESFLCGPGTNFNQKILACDFWYNFNCQDSPSFYNANADIGKIPDPYRPTGEHSISRDHTRITQKPVYPDFPKDEQRPISVDDPYDRPGPPVGLPPRVSVPAPPPRVSVPAPPPRVSIPAPPPRISVPAPPPRISVPAPPPRISVPAPPPRISVPAPPPRISVPAPPPRIFVPAPPPRISVPAPPPRVSVPPAWVPEPPRISEPAHPPTRIQPPPTKVRQPPIQQTVDSEYDFEDAKPPSRPYVPPPPPPPRPALPPPPPPRVVHTTARPVFPPVSSPPRVSRPPLSPPVSVLPPAVPSRPRVPIRPQFPSVSDHPDAGLKGSTGYRPQDPPRVPQPSRPIDTSYPSPPPPKPVITRPERPSSPPFQQEHVEVDYVPLPPSQRPPPPPPRPVQQERIPPPPRRPPPVIQTEYVPPPPPTPRKPSVIVQQEEYVPPPPPPPPVAPSVVFVQQKPQGPPARPSVVVSVRPQQPPRPRPVFPPASDHPNANVKGGPGYQQPPPQPPRFEPTRVTRPVTVPRQPPIDSTRTQTSRVKTPLPQVSTGYKPPVDPDRVKQPSQSVDHGYEPPSRIPSVSVPLPPPRPQTPSFPPPRPQIIDHPSANIKGGSVYDPPVAPQPPQPPRITSPTSSVGIRRPESSVGYEIKGGSPPRPTTGIKTAIKTPEDPYKPPIPYPPSVPPSRVKVPSTPSVQEIRPQFPAPRPEPIDHPNANVKGGPGYQPPRPQPVQVPPAPRPVISQPPFSPGIPSQRTKTAPRPPASTGRGFQTSSKRTEDVYPPVAVQEIYEPPRKPLSPALPSSPRDPVSTVKQITSIKQPQHGPPSSPHRASVKTKQPPSDYNTGSSYKRGSENYPKPEFQQPAYPSGPYQPPYPSGPYQPPYPSGPYQPPISTPPRSSDLSKKRPSSPTTSHETRSQFPSYPAGPVSQQTIHTRQPAGSHPAEYPYREIPGHQPPHQRQVFPHRDNPDHPNESIKGSGAYRPPPPADFQPAGSEVVQQTAEASQESQKEEETSKLGDTGTE